MRFQGLERSSASVRRKKKSEISQTRTPTPTEIFRPSLVFGGKIFEGQNNGRIDMDVYSRHERTFLKGKPKNEIRISFEIRYL